MSINLNEYSLYKDIPFMKDLEGNIVNTMRAFGKFNYYYINNEHFLDSCSNKDKYSLIIVDRDNEILFLSTVCKEVLHSAYMCSISDETKKFINDIENSKASIGVSLELGRNLHEIYDEYFFKNKNFSNLVELEDEDVEKVLDKFIEYVKGINTSNRKSLIDKFGYVKDFRD